MENNDDFTTATTPQPDPEFTVAEASGRIFLNVFIFVFGIMGNSLILGVYWSKVQRTSTNVLIMGLAGVDLIVCVLRSRSVFQFSCVVAGKGIPPVVYKLQLPNVLTLGTSAVLTGVIALDRYDCVCRPHNRLFNPRRAKVALGVCFAASVILTLPVVLDRNIASLDLQEFTLVLQMTEYLILLLLIIVCYGRVYAVISRRGHRVRRVQPIARSKIQKVANVNPGAPRAEMPQTKSASDSSNWASTSASTSVLPPSQLPVASNRHGWIDESSISKRIQDRELPSGNLPPMRASVQRKVTRMLCMTSVIFLLTWLPYWIHVAVEMYQLNGGTDSHSLLHTLFAAAILVPVNSTVNPIIYGLFNEKFRKDCKIFTRKIRLWLRKHMCRATF